MLLIVHELRTTYMSDLSQFMCRFLFTVLLDDMNLDISENHQPHLKDKYINMLIGIKFKKMYFNNFTRDIIGQKGICIDHV